MKINTKYIEEKLEICHLFVDHYPLMKSFAGKRSVEKNDLAEDFLDSLKWNRISID